MVDVCVCTPDTDCVRRLVCAARFCLLLSRFCWRLEFLNSRLRVDIGSFCARAHMGKMQAHVGWLCAPLPRGKLGGWGVCCCVGGLGEGFSNREIGGAVSWVPGAGRGSGKVRDASGELEMRLAVVYGGVEVVKGHLGSREANGVKCFDSRKVKNC